MLGGVGVRDVPSHSSAPLMEAGEVAGAVRPGQAGNPRQIINHHEPRILRMPRTVVPPVRAGALPPGLPLLALLRLLRVVLQRAPPREIVVVPAGQRLRVEGGIVDVLHTPYVVPVLLEALGALGGRGAGRGVEAVPGAELTGALGVDGGGVVHGDLLAVDTIDAEVPLAELRSLPLLRLAGRGTHHLAVQVLDHPQRRGPILILKRVRLTVLGVIGVEDHGRRAFGLGAAAGLISLVPLLADLTLARISHSPVTHAQSADGGFRGLAGHIALHAIGPGGIALVGHGWSRCRSRRRRSRRRAWRR
mmetsp:Transcript_41992/g.100951  ORF Transcript_41992/g.100951 Transcript_41992/m.100951 type:complete len:305 (+) Transcript_41992:623-1537(+)